MVCHCVHHLLVIPYSWQMTPLHHSENHFPTLGSIWVVIAVEDFLQGWHAEMLDLTPLYAGPNIAQGLTFLPLCHKKFFFFNFQHHITRHLTHASSENWNVKIQNGVDSFVKYTL